MCKKIKAMRIFWSSFNGIDSVTLCLNEKIYNKECNKFGYDNYIDNDGVCTRFIQKGKRGECVIGIKTLDNIDYISAISLITHEIAHAVDFIMEEDHITDMEFRAYAIQDMLAKTMMYIDKLGIYKKNKEVKTPLYLTSYV